MARPTHLLLDFYGTLVDHTHAADRGYPRSYELFRTFGAPHTYEQFMSEWWTIWVAFENDCERNLREFTMDAACAALVDATCPRPPEPDQIAAFTTCFIDEWQHGVIYPDGIADLVKQLASRYRLAIVSNTSDALWVHRHLAALDIAHLVDAVVLSVEVGWRKPHPAIYQGALDQLGIGPSAALFVGDTPEADFAGPRRVGIQSMLISQSPLVPEQYRLDSIFDLPERLDTVE